MNLTHLRLPKYLVAEATGILPNAVVSSGSGGVSASSVSVLASQITSLATAVSLVTSNLSSLATSVSNFANAPFLLATADPAVPNGDVFTSTNWEYYRKQGTASDPSYLDGRVNAEWSSTGNFGSNDEFAIPVLIARQCLLTGAIIRMNTAGSASYMRAYVSVYDSAATALPMPGNRLASFYFNCATTASMVADLASPITLTPGLYWWASCGNGDQSMFFQTCADFFPILGLSGSGSIFAAYPAGWKWVNSGGLLEPPDPWHTDAVPLESSNTAPSAGLKVVGL